MITALVLGTVLAVGALAFVLYPLFYGSPTRARVRAAVVPGAVAGEDVAIAALREIEFDRATGKLSDADYADLKDRYTRQALTVMRRREAAAAQVGKYGPPVDDEIEAAVRAYRAAHAECPECGPRAELDAVFCSTCGRYLPGACPACGRTVDQPGSRFCPGCGESLAA